MTAPELKPCPFCGAVDPEWLASHVVCDCGATGPRQDVDREYQADAMRALTDWNRRADLAAVQPAQVRVKPLVWEEDTDSDSDDFRAFVARSPTLHLRYIVRKVYGGFWKLTGCVPFGTPDFLTLEAAKAAAQADYEARILAALEPLPDQTVEIDLRVAMMEELEKAASESLWVPEEYYMNEVISDCCAFLRSDRSQPDPRDEVIKGLVDALCEAMIVPEAWYISGFPNISVDAIDQTKRAVPLARAALAAAKAVQRD